jgi:hypothetical protein
MKACHSSAKADEWFTIQNSTTEESKTVLKLVESQIFLQLCNRNTEMEIQVAKHTPLLQASCSNITLKMAALS